jgi:Orthopoxvirus protein of unknown function (DUF830).
VIRACPEINNTPAQQETDAKRYIYVLLLHYPDVFSKIFRFISRCRFSHASIGVSGSDGVFYSYVTKGFRIELPKQHPKFKQQEVPCRLYRIEVSDEIHRVTRDTLDDHAKQAHNYKYNNLGVALCLMRIVYPFGNRFFCSQFVSEILAQMRAVPLEKHCSLYLPDDFEKMEGLDLCFSGYLSQLVKQPKSMACLAV